MSATLLTSTIYDERGRVSKTTDSSAGSRQYHYLPTGEPFEIDVLGGSQTRQRLYHFGSLGRATDIQVISDNYFCRSPTTRNAG